MKKRLLVFTVALTMITSFFHTSMAFAETTEGAMIGKGAVEDVLSYTLHENGDIIVNANESNEELAYAMAASYEDGKMVSMDKISMEDETKLHLQDWGKSVKLFAVSKYYAPICESVEIWNANGLVKTAADLKAAIEGAQEGKILVVNVDKNAVLAENVEATFLGEELIINFNNVDMAENDLTIHAPNATSIVLNDKTDGEDGTEVGTLTIDAPKADVENNIVADSIEIIAVKDGTFHAKEKVRKEIKIRKGAVEVDHKAGDTTVTVPEEADGNVTIKGKVNEVNIETINEVVLDAEVTTANVTAEGANVIVDENAVVATVVVSAETSEEAKTVISGEGIIDIIEAIADVIISATNVTEVEVGSGVTVELHANVEYVNVPAADEAPTIKVEIGVTIENVTTEANVNVTGSGSIENVTVNNNSSENVTITAPEGSAITVESIVNTGSSDVVINNKNPDKAELPEDSSKANRVVDTVEEVNIDFAASDEWRTEGYLYEFFDISFDGAEWAVTEEDFDWSKVTYWVNGEQFIWDQDTSKPGDFKVEADLMGYSYDWDTETGYAQGLIAAYETNVKAGESYKVEIRFPSDYLRITDKDYVISGKTFTVDLVVNITESATELTPAKDTLDTITIDAGTADDWRTEGYVYVEKEITFDGADWRMEPYWEEHVTYWIDGKQFQWIPGVSVVGDYDVEVEMVPEYDEDGKLSMKAMVFAYMENVENGDSFDVKIKVPTYSLVRNDDLHRITRDESAVIDFKVQVEGCENYVPPVVDRVEDIYIDLSASDEWRTEGYLYELFDVDFNAAEWSAEEMDWNNVTYWVNGEQFIWDWETSKPGDFAVEADIFDYSYDEESKTGYAPGLIAAYVDNVNADEIYEVEMQFPSNHLRVTDPKYVIKSGETFTVDFNVHIVDSEEELTPAKDTLKTIPIYVTDADENGDICVEEEITFNGAAWRMEPYWDEHVTYKVSDKAVGVEMVPQYDEETGKLSMYAKVTANTEDVAVGDSVSVKIFVPTYSLERTAEAYRITRDETAVIDFKVFISEGEGYTAPVVDTVDDIDIDLSASDEWRTEGYLYEFFDIEFNAAEWAAEEMNWDQVEYFVNGEKFEWIVEGDEPSEPGDFAVEVDLFDYYYDDEAETGTATGLVAAYVNNVKEEQKYNIEIRFPSDHLRVTDENYTINSGETFTVDFDVNIVDSKETLKPAKDTLEEMLLYTKVTDDDGSMYAEKEITFNGAVWRMEPYWDEHVTYEVSDDAVAVEMVPRYDEENGELFMDAIVEANVEDVAVGEDVSVKIFVPTYSLERTKETYRITRNETAVIDFTVKVTDAEPFFAKVNGTRVDCYMDDEKVTEGEITVKFTYRNYADTVTFGLMEHCEDGEDIVVAVESFTSETESGTEGSVTFDMTDVPVANYEVVYRVGNTWFGTDEYIDLTEEEPETVEDRLILDVEPVEIVAGGEASFDVLGIDKHTRFTAGDEVTVTLSEGFSFAENDVFYDHNRTPIDVESWSKNEIVVLAPEDPGFGFDLEELTIIADDSLAEGTKATMTASMAGYEPVSKTVATVIAGGTQTPDTQNVNFKLNGSGNNYYLTWNDMGYSGYQVCIGDNIMWVMNGSTRADNLLHFIPCADEDTTYDIVLNGLDAEFNDTELARLEDALEVTVSGSAAEYEAEFSETVVNVTWTPMPEGVAYS